MLLSELLVPAASQIFLFANLRLKISLLCNAVVTFMALNIVICVFGSWALFQ